MEYISEIHKLLKIGGPQDLPDLTMPTSHENLPVANEAVLENNFFHSLEAVNTPTNYKGFLIYPFIFLGAFIFFYGALNFPAVSAQVRGWFIKPQSEQILGSQSADYYKWISNYFYAVMDPSLLSPNNDIDRDGLSNQDEFIIQSNPIIADSDDDGFSDGIEVINSMNLWGSGPMSKQQRKLAEKLNLITISNRISYNVAQNTGMVASAHTIKFDLEKPGKLSIPRLKLEAPLIWSKDPSNFDKDLTMGVIHYPGTAMPGETGVIYVSGHSSDYVWKRDPYHNIFAQLNFLTAGDDIFVDVYDKEGKVYNFRYQVTGSNIYAPDDQAQFFENGSVSKLNLSTCWPIGTQKDRLVVSSILKPL